MENLDVFESVFKRAARDPFQYSFPKLENVLIVTDCKNEKLCDGVQAWLKDHPLFEKAAWSCVDGNSYTNWAD